MVNPLKFYSSDITALTGGAATIELDLGSNGHAHWFFGVQFYTDSAGTAGTPTAGTITPSVKTEVLPDVYQPLSDIVNLAAGNEQVSWDSPSRMLKLVLASVAGGSVTHFKVFASSVEK